MSETKWMVELHRTGKPALFLHGESPESIAEAIIDADDYYGEAGTHQRMEKCWTSHALMGNAYSEAGAKQTAEALDRVCGGVAVAVEHMFNCGIAPDGVFEQMGIGKCPEVPNAEITGSALLRSPG